MRFDELQLITPLLRAVASEGYTEPTPIQRECIPHVLSGRDLLGCAQTGTGKTAAFALPILQRFASKPAGRGKRPIRALVLTPTRELAAQVAESFETYGKRLELRTACIFGGVGQNPQVIQLQRGVDVLVATPGRLLDLASQGQVDFRHLEVFVLDEADRMLDMGFLPDVRRVIATLPRQRQTLLFSATMPNDIRELANHILIDPVHVAVTPVASTAEKIEQSVFFVSKGNKRALLAHVLQDPDMDRVLVFTRTKHGANRVVKELDRADIPALAIHGNKSQSARERALAQFKNGETRVLVATDIAARGLDVEGISHVINFDFPDVAESYVHRIGRTARAGAGGKAFSFCDADEQPLLRAIERLIRMRVPVVQDHPHAEHHPHVAEPVTKARNPRAQGRRPEAPRKNPRQHNQRPRNEPSRGPERPLQPASNAPAKEAAAPLPPAQRKRRRTYRPSEPRR
jgi:ATP-dependent RNA helicase RhlE